MLCVHGKEVVSCRGQLSHRLLQVLLAALTARRGTATLAILIIVTLRATRANILIELSVLDIRRVPVAIATARVSLYLYLLNWWLLILVGGRWLIILLIRLSGSSLISSATLADGLYHLAYVLIKVVK